MARGWESKNIEDQMAEAENARRTSPKRALTPEQIARRAQRDGLNLSRARTQTALQTACDARYRGLLERTLAHLDEELARLGSDEQD